MAALPGRLVTLPGLSGLGGSTSAGEGEGGEA
jgi:hypothetical protein